MGGLLVLDGVFLLLLAIFSVLDIAGPERWWLTGFLLYMPRGGWAVACALLLLPTAFVARKMAFALAVSLLWILGPLMGLRIPLRLPALSQSSPETRLRVLTYNVKWGWRNAHEMANEIEQAKPDLVQFQDSDGVLSSEVGRVISPEKGWTIRVSGQYIVASRWKLSELTSIDISFPGSNHHAVSAILTPGSAGAPITVYNVHLLSARYGLLAVRSRDIAFMKTNLENRLFEANRLAEVIASRTPGPALLTGDLNAPPSSLVKRRLKAAGLRDTFETAGLGYGYTYGSTTKARHSYVRIDCILTSPELRTDSVWVGGDLGSDHCPVIADLSLPRN